MSEFAFPIIFPGIIYNSGRDGLPIIPGVTLKLHCSGFTTATDGNRFYLLGKVVGWWVFWEIEYLPEAVNFRTNPTGRVLKTEGPLSWENAFFTIPISPETVAWNPLCINS